MISMERVCTDQVQNYVIAKHDFHNYALPEVFFSKSLNFQRFWDSKKCFETNTLTFIRSKNPEIKINRKTYGTNAFFWSKSNSKWKSESVNSDLVDFFRANWIYTILVNELIFFLTSTKCSSFLWKIPNTLLYKESWFEIKLRIM